jgi:hypothetical protein
MDTGHLSHAEVAGNWLEFVAIRWDGVGKFFAFREIIIDA